MKREDLELGEEVYFLRWNGEDVPEVVRTTVACLGRFVHVKKPSAANPSLAETIDPVDLYATKAKAWDVVIEQCDREVAAAMGRMERAKAAAAASLADDPGSP
jgi:hypothetical protein